MAAPPRILLSFAHPDDESFAAAGLARRYADAGATVTLVTATRGDAGRAGDPPLCTREELPARREAELRAAAAILGIGSVHVLAYRDRQLADAPPDEIRRQLVTIIRQNRPHVVVTFDPNGATRHPDHVAIARFTADAASAAADPRWYPERAAHSVPRLLWTSPVLPWEVASLDLRHHPGVDFALDVSAYRSVKAAALKAHRTQHVSIDRCFFAKSNLDEILSIEVFRQGWGPALGSLPAHDVLDGIDLDE